MNKDRIKELAAKINQARHDYYNHQSKVSDKVYDAWIDELATLDPKNLAVIGIGAEPVSNWDKYTHKVILGSLNKCQTQEEFQQWYDKYVGAGNEMCGTLKLDGLSVSMIYENGTLVKASTRGSGTVGELITANVARMQGVPLRLKHKVSATVRGEILLSKQNFAKYFQNYSNTRNSASGVARRYDGDGCDKLTVLSYHLISEDYDEDLDTQEQQLSTLEDLGFIVPPYIVFNTPVEVFKWKDNYQHTLRDQYEFDLDGLVVHNNSLAKQAEHGMLHGRPYASIAYKFDSVSREGYIVDIQIQCGNSGRLTPVAVFDPKVSLMGAEVEKASLHNFSNIEELGIGIGATVLVCRSNDVIPFVEEVIVPPSYIFPRPTHCPECNSPVVERGEYIQCPNMECRAQVIGRLANWIKELNLLEWGDRLLERLVDSGKVETVADLYRLTVNDLATLDRMGDKSAQKCYDILHSNMEIPLEIFLGALSIPMIGQSTIKAIMGAGCNTLEKFGQLGANQFSQVPGVGPTKSESLAQGLKDNQQLILSLLDNGIKIKEIIMGKLSGKSFAITGTLSMKRAEVEKLITDNGGEMKSSVGKTTTYLIIADPASTSSKAQSARKLGVKLIDENDLFDMVD